MPSIIFLVSVLNVATGTPSCLRFFRDQTWGQTLQFLLQFPQFCDSCSEHSCGAQAGKLTLWIPSSLQSHTHTRPGSELTRGVEFWHLGSSQRKLEQNGTAGMLEMCSFFHCSEMLPEGSLLCVRRKKKKNSELLINS